MISAIGSVYGSSIDYSSPSTTPTASSSSDLFNKITTSSGGDGSSLTKEQVADYTLKTKSDKTTDKDQSDFLNKLTDNWNKTTNGHDKLSKNDFEKSYDTFQAKKQSSDAPNIKLLGHSNDKTESVNSTDSDISSTSGSSALTVFLQSHASSVGSSGDKITKAELVSYLNSLMTSGTSDSNDIEAIKKILAKFDTVSTGNSSVATTATASQNKYEAAKTPNVGDFVISTFEYSV